MKKTIYNILYRFLKNDMINRLKSKSYGTQFIDDVMDAFDMPTTLTDEYVATLKKEHTSECFDMGGCHEIEEI